MEESNLLIPGIQAVLAEEVDARDPSNITMSSLGHCARQLAYRFFEVPGKPLSWRSYMVFDDGDMAHDQLRSLIYRAFTKLASCYKITSQEASVVHDGVGGHIDGMLIHDADKCSNSQHQNYLLEVKSMNDRGFQQLRKTKEIGFEYRCQVSGYLAAMGLQYAIILVKNKNNGDLAEFRYSREDGILQERMAVVESLCLSSTAEQVPREYSPNSKGNLPWQCGYCPFTQICWRDMELVEKKENKYQVNMKLFLSGGARHNETGSAFPAEGPVEDEGANEELTQC